MTDVTPRATIELRDLQLVTVIGTYTADDVVPDAHLLDLTLGVLADLVLVAGDDMALVFDYDPLIAQIDQIAREQHYQTQEYLMTRIVAACASYPQVTTVDICLRKRPVMGGTGSLGVRLYLGDAALAQHREHVTERTTTLPIPRPA